MARAPLTIRTLPAKWAIVPTTLVWEAPDVAEGNDFISTGSEFILVNNTGGVPYTITVASTPDVEGRSGDIAAYSVAAGQMHAFQIFTQDGWMQTNGKINVNINNVALEICVCKIP